MSVPVQVRTPQIERRLAPESPRVGIHDVFYVPSAPGDYAMSLSLPDPLPGLAGRPAYAIRLANPGAWDETTGRNSLDVSLVVTR